MGGTNTNTVIIHHINQKLKNSVDCLLTLIRWLLGDSTLFSKNGITV